MNIAVAASYEPPCPASQDVQASQPDSGADREMMGFPAHLKACDDSGKRTSNTAGSDKEEKDNGMQDDSDAADALCGIVGILEGFGLPDYQSDNTITLAGAQADVQPAQADAQPVAIGAQGNTDKEPGGLPEQFAGMLETIPGGGKAPTQDEILQVVGRHLDSLENTNETGAGVKTQSGEGQAALPAVESTAGEKAGASVEQGGQLPDAANTKRVVTTGQAGLADAKSVSDAAGADNAADAEVLKAADTVGDTGSTAEKSGKVQHAGEAVQQTAVAAQDIQTAYTAEKKAADVPAAQSTTENILRIVDRVKVQAADGQHEFDIELKPDFLGKVNIRLSMKDGSISMQIKTDDVSVKSMFSDQVSSLQGMLKDRGIPVSSIDVTCEDQAFLNDGSSAFAQHGGDGRPDSRSYFTPAASADAYEPAVRGEGGMYLGGSSMEFLA